MELQYICPDATLDPEHEDMTIVRCNKTEQVIVLQHDKPDASYEMPFCATHGEFAPCVAIKCPEAIIE